MEIVEPIEKKVARDPLEFLNVILFWSAWLRKLGGKLMGHDGVFSEGNYKKLLSWLDRSRLVCVSCGRDLHPGDQFHRSGKVIIKDNSFGVEHGNKNCIFYHAECFEELFL